MQQEYGISADGEGRDQLGTCLTAKEFRFPRHRRAPAPGPNTQSGDIFTRVPNSR